MITFRLAVQDLVHEWILSCCLVFSLSAIIAPLLLVFGFQFGAVQNLRRELLEDPRNREITPISSHQFDSNWFGKAKNWPEVQFVVPEVRRLAASLVVKKLKAKDSKRLDILPTAPGDPLLQEIGIDGVASREIVLSQAAAELIGATRGAVVLAEATRNQGGVAERAEIELKIRGIVTNRLRSEEVGYVSLAFLTSVEDYKDGLAVPALGWPGAVRPAFGEYDGALLFTEQPISVEQEARLIINTGFARVQSIDRNDLPRIGGFSADAAKRVYHLVAGETTIEDASLAAVRSLLRGAEATVVPWVKPISTELRSTPEGYHARLRLIGLPSDPTLEKKLGIQQVFREVAGANGTNRVWKVFVCDAPMPQEGTPMQLIAEGRVGRLEIPVVVVRSTNVPAGNAWCAVEQAGLLRSLDDRPLELDAATGAIKLGRRGFAAFRLYARRLEDVATLERRFRGEGIAVVTRAERIEDVTALARHLRLVFYLVAVVGLIGGVASLLASLYASVERKRRVFGLLRLMGLPPARLSLIPVHQALIIGLMSFGLANLVFQMVAGGINEAMTGRLGRGGKACTLPLSVVPAGLLVVLCSASLAASAAGCAVRRFEPADCIRDE